MCIAYQTCVKQTSRLNNTPGLQPTAFTHSMEDIGSKAQKGTRQGHKNKRKGESFSLEDDSKTYNYWLTLKRGKSTTYIT